MNMRSSIISLSLAAVIGIVIGLLLQSPETPKQSSKLSTQANHPPANLANDTQNQAPSLAKLSQQLQQEISAREALQNEVTNLSKKLAALPTTTIQDGTAKKYTLPTPTDETHRTDKNVWFNQQALIDAGMEQTEADQLKMRFEEMELAKLYLRDQAIREGWSSGKRYREERQKLEAKTDGIKDELGDDAYDAYLFAAGQSNRVAVQSVLSGSAASNAGILSGDQIIRYDGERIYNGRDLRTATSQGDLTETIAVQVLRDNKQIELYVQRGPLGIRMTSVSSAPSP